MKKPSILKKFAGEIDIMAMRKSNAHAHNHYDKKVNSVSKEAETIKDIVLSVHTKSISDDGIMGCICEIELPGSGMQLTLTPDNVRYIKAKQMVIDGGYEYPDFRITKEIDQKAVTYSMGSPLALRFPPNTTRFQKEITRQRLWTTLVRWLDKDMAAALLLGIDTAVKAAAELRRQHNDYMCMRAYDTAKKVRELILKEKQDADARFTQLYNVQRLGQRATDDGPYDDGNKKPDDGRTTSDDTGKLNSLGHPTGDSTGKSTGDIGDDDDTFNVELKPKEEQARKEVKAYHPAFRHKVACEFGSDWAKYSWQMRYSLLLLEGDDILATGSTLDVTTGSHSGIITLKKTEEKPVQETFTVTSCTNVCNDGEHGDDDAGELDIAGNIANDTTLEEGSTLDVSTGSRSGIITPNYKTQPQAIKTDNVKSPAGVEGIYDVYYDGGGWNECIDTGDMTGELTKEGSLIVTTDESWGDIMLAASEHNHSYDGGYDHGYDHGHDHGYDNGEYGDNDAGELDDANGHDGHHPIPLTWGDEMTADDAYADDYNYDGGGPGHNGDDGGSCDDNGSSCDYGGGDGDSGHHSDAGGHDADGHYDANSGDAAEEANWDHEDGGYDGNYDDGDDDGGHDDSSHDDSGGNGDDDGGHDSDACHFDEDYNAGDSGW